MTRDEEMGRARRAEVLLSDPLIVEAFQAVEDEAMRQWRASVAKDNGDRERIWLIVKLLDRVKGHLRAVIETGKLADAQVKQFADIERAKKLGLF
jgi:hypothetical protein